jgi:hypothetical protein
MAMHPVTRELFAGLGQVFRKVGHRASKAMMASVLADGGEVLAQAQKGLERARERLAREAAAEPPAEDGDVVDEPGSRR